MEQKIGENNYETKFETRKIQTLQLNGCYNQTLTQSNSKAVIRRARFSLPTTSKVRSVEQFRIKR